MYITLFFLQVHADRSCNILDVSGVLSHRCAPHTSSSQAPARLAQPDVHAREGHGSSREGELLDFEWFMWSLASD